MGLGEKDRKCETQDPKSPGRREWLLRLGETAALIGFSGAVREGGADASYCAASSPTGSPLPPGLYEPSNDHLAHALSNESRLHPVPTGSETDYARSRSGPFRPDFLSQQDFEIVRRIVRLVLGGPDGLRGADVRSGDPALGSTDRSEPQDDALPPDEVAEWIDLRLARAAAVRAAAQQLAPSHRALALAFYGSNRVGEWETADPERTCWDGLRWLEDSSQQRYQQSFLGLNEGRQLELLQIVSDDRPDNSQANAGTRLFQWIKGEIIRGYYTSRSGLKELDYRGNGFYVEPPGCEGSGQTTETRAPRPSDRT